MKAVWIPIGYCFLNASYHRQRFAEARAGRNFSELRPLQESLLRNNLIPSRHELMLFWELLVRTRFNDQDGPLDLGSADEDEKFLDVRKAWTDAGNPEIQTNGHQTELATVIGLAALDVAFRDALLDAAVDDPVETRVRLSKVLLDRKIDWGSFSLDFEEIGQLASFLAEIKPMERQNPLEIFHLRAGFSHEKRPARSEFRSFPDRITPTFLTRPFCESASWNKSRASSPPPSMASRAKWACAGKNSSECCAMPAS